MPDETKNQDAPPVYPQPEAVADHETVPLNKQYAIGFGVAILVLVGVIALSNYLIKGTPSLGGTDMRSVGMGGTPTPTALIPSAGDRRYENNDFGFSFRYPSDWRAVYPVDDSSDFVGFQPNSAQDECFKSETVLCPVVLSVLENRENKPLKSFPENFYPNELNAYGGVAVVPVGNTEGTRLYNYLYTGGHFVFVQRDGYIVKFVVQSRSMVPLDIVDAYEKMLTTFEFSERPKAK